MKLLSLAGSAVLLATACQPVRSRLSAAEHKTELTTLGRAREAGWEVMRGKLSKLHAPELSISDDATVGETALRVDVKQEGEWQGIVLVDRIDLSEFAGMEFYIKQNVRTKEPQWPCAVQVFFEDDGYALADPRLGTGEWTKVHLPFREPPWKLENQPDGWGRTTRLRFYPYRQLDTPGEFFMIDGLRFIPKSTEPQAASPGLTYTYETSPADGADEQRSLLLDRQLDAERQVSWPAYGGDPAVVFDVGEEQTLTKVTLNAHASPAQNIASATIEVSRDGKQWTPAGSIVNESAVQSIGEQKLAVTCFGVGRYVRITLKRPRVDVPIVLGEVALERRSTIPADREVRQTAHFEGPALPAMDSPDYVSLRGSRITVSIHRPTGVTAGLWTADGKRILLRGWDRYVFENRDALVESSEYADTSQVVTASEDSLVIEGTNKDLGGLTIRKEYRLAANEREEWLEEVTSFTYTGRRPDQFVTLLTNVAIDEAFRRGAYYEGLQVRCDRILADKVVFKRVAPATKALMLARTGSFDTVTQYRCRVNGRFCLPYYGQIPMEAYNNTSYNRCGWEIGHSTLKLSGGEPVSTQVHTAILSDGRFGWERHFVSLPEYRRYVAGFTRPAWLNDIKTIVLDSYRCALWRQTERTAGRFVSIFDDGHIVASSLTHMDGVWGELPTSGDVIGLFGTIIPSDEIARMVESLRQIPRFKAGLYMWLTSVNRTAKVFRDHPDWFMATNKAGEPRVIFPQLKSNFGRIMLIPEHRDFVVDQVAALHERYPQDLWYLDGGNTTVNMIDWQSLRVSQDYHGQDFCRRVRKRVREINSECAIFFNGADDRLADIGFAEIGRHFGKEWRRAAARMYSCKVRQSFDPDRLMSPLYWVGPGSRYLRICTGLGFPPSGPSGLRTDVLLSYAPYCAAAFETRGFQFSPTRYTPDWREDEETDIEMYALRAGRGLVLSVIPHRKDERPQALGAEVPSDVAAPGDTVYVAHHVMKDIATYKIPNSDFTNRDAYQKTGWATGAVAELRSVRTLKVDEAGWIQFTAELPPDLLSLFSLVKTPVYIWSRNGMRANFLLPSVRKLHTKTTMDGDELTVTVAPDAAPRELLVFAPPGRRVADGKEVALHGLFGCTISVPPSDKEAHTALRFVDVAENAAKIELSRPGTVEAGGTLDLRVTGAPEGPVCYNVWRAGTLVYAGSSQERTIALPVPVQAHNGEYVVETRHRSGARATAAFKLTGHQATDRIPPDTPPLKRNVVVTRVNATQGEAAILSKATLEYGRCRPSVDVDELTLRAEVPRECVTYWAQNMAGVELRGVRAAAVRIEHNMYPVCGLYPERHVLYETHPNAFIGFFIDYGTPKGYTKRVALSVGKMSLKRKSKHPEWGAAKPPDHYLRLPSTIYTGEKVEGLLDLTAWAPRDWDGRVWLTTVMDLALPSRWLGMTLLKLNPPADSVTPLKTEDVTATMSQTKPRTIRAVRLTMAPKLDGGLDEAAWQGAKPASGLFVLAKQGKPASQQTDIRVGYDDRFIYVGITSMEKEKKNFDTTSGAAGRPWWDDGIEFILAPPSWKGEFLHQIVSADAVTFQEIATHLHEKQRKSSLPVICKTEKLADRFTVEAAIPIGKAGVPAPKPGERWRAQFMRTRVMLDGRREHATWAVTGSLHDHTKFGSLAFE